MFSVKHCHQKKGVTFILCTTRLIKRHSFSSGGQKSGDYFELTGGFGAVHILGGELQFEVHT